MFGVGVLLHDDIVVVQLLERLHRAPGEDCLIQFLVQLADVAHATRQVHRSRHSRKAVFEREVAPLRSLGPPEFQQVPEIQTGEPE